MKNTYTQASDFRQIRDFGAKISATFEFLGAHFRPLGQSLLYIVLPVALIAGIAMGVMQNGLFDAALNQNGDKTAARQMVMQYATGGGGLAVLALLLAHLLIAAAVYSYVRLCMDGTPAPITPSQVWAQVRQVLPRLLLYGIGLILSILAASLLFVIPGIYLSVPLSLFFAVFIMEGNGFGDTFSRCLALAKGNWWATLGLMFIMSLIQSFAGIIFQLPQYAVILAKTLHWGFLGSDIAMLITQSFATIGHIFLYVPFQVALCFQYFNLSEEKDGWGMRAMVAQLGQAPAPVQNQAHRPDDEGEY